MATSTCATRATASFAPTTTCRQKDAYVPVRMSKANSARKGDHLVGMMRPAGRNENPAMLEIQTVNGRPPEEAKKRRKFEDMTALFPDELGSRMKMTRPI